MKVKLIGVVESLASNGRMLRIILTDHDRVVSCKVNHPEKVITHKRVMDTINQELKLKEKDIYTPNHIIHGLKRKG